MTLKNNRAPLLSNIKLYVSFHHHMWFQTGVTVRKRLSWVVTCDLDLLHGRYPGPWWYQWRCQCFRLAWLPIAPQLILQKIVSYCLRRIGSKEWPRFRKISCSWAPKNGVQHVTAIYPIPQYTQPRYIRSTLYFDISVIYPQRFCRV